MDEEKDQQPASPVTEEVQPAKKAKKPLSKKKKIIIGVIVALFVIGAAGGNGNGAGNTAASSGSQTSASTTVEKKEKKKTPAKVKVDKSGLESYIDSYGSVVADGYTEDSYQAYSSALENAKSVDADEDATQSQVDSAKGNLYTAYNGLGGTRVLEDDTVTVYGTCVGQYSYQSTLGAKISLPGLYADQVEINQ